MATKKDFRMLFCEEDGTKRIVHVLARKWQHNSPALKETGMSFFYYRADQYVLCDERSGRVIGLSDEKDFLGLALFLIPGEEAIAHNIATIKALPAIDEVGATEEIWDYPREEDGFYLYHSA